MLPARRRRTIKRRDTFDFHPPAEATFQSFLNMYSGSEFNERAQIGTLEPTVIRRAGRVNLTYAHAAYVWNSGQPSKYSTRDFGEEVEDFILVRSSGDSETTMQRNCHSAPPTLSKTKQMSNKVRRSLSVVFLRAIPSLVERSKPDLQPVQQI